MVKLSKIVWGYGKESNSTLTLLFLFKNAGIIALGDYPLLNSLLMKCNFAYLVMCYGKNSSINLT